MGDLVATAHHGGQGVSQRLLDPVGHPDSGQKFVDLSRVIVAGPFQVVSTDRAITASTVWPRNSARSKRMKSLWSSRSLPALFVRVSPAGAVDSFHSARLRSRSSRLAWTKTTAAGADRVIAPDFHPERPNGHAIVKRRRGSRPGPDAIGTVPRSPQRTSIRLRPPERPDLDQVIEERRPRRPCRSGRWRWCCWRSRGRGRACSSRGRWPRRRRAGPRR